VDERLIKKFYRFMEGGDQGMRLAKLIDRTYVKDREAAGLKPPHYGPITDRAENEGQILAAYREKKDAEYHARRQRR
jgi:hypothetical protein